MKKLKVGETFTDQAGNFCTVRENGTLRVTTVNNEPSLTIQSEKDSCDINKIVARFASTGVMSNVVQSMPQYADFSEVVDYHTALNQVIAAQESFMSLPADVRSRFRNDPGELLSFLDDEKNLDEAISLGLVEPAKPVIPGSTPAAGVSAEG